jgi:ATP-binding cassette subfamily B protein
MPVVETIPASIEQTLRSLRNGHGEEPLTAAVRSDIGADGLLRERWVIVDSETVRVFSPNGASGATLDLSMPIEEIDGAKTETLIGNGALLVSKGSDTVELTRFTGPLAARMGDVARIIDALAKDKELPEVSLDDAERTCPTCGRALPKDSDVCPFCLDKTKTFARLFKYATAYKAAAVLVLLLLLVGTAMQLVPGKIVQYLTDDVFVPNGHTSAAFRQDRLVLLVVLLALSQLLNLIVTVARGWISAYLSNNITRQLRQEVFERLQWLGLSFYDKRQTGALMSRVTQDVNELNNFLVDGMQFLVVNGLSIVGIIVILLASDWRLTLLVLIPVPIVVYAARATWQILRRRFDRLWSLRSALSAGLNASLSGARVVKAFAQEQHEVDLFTRRNVALAQGTIAVERGYLSIFPLIGFLMTTGMYIVYIVGGKQVLHNEIRFGVLQLFLFNLGQLYGPLQGMTRIGDWLGRALTAAERVFEILDTNADVRDTDDAVAMPHIEGAVAFRNVSFGYDKARRVLENLDLEIKPGEMIGLVGHSGAGKTTIINLLSRFYDPVEGSITIDGVDMRKVKLNDLRRQLGIVLQESFLFPGTIASNIAYANPEASPQEIMRAAKAANAHDFIMRFPDGYDTQVGERGVKLSGGERQRISIARAVLHNPRILILDEATASVDTETEKQIQEAIQRLIKGRTTFAIAHRLSTLRNADRLIVMDRGKLVEMGTHSELMEKEDGVFRRLVDMQTEINKLQAETAAYSS